MFLSKQGSTQTPRPVSPKSEILTTVQLSQYLQVPEGTLKRWRCEGTGPSFFYVGRSPRYRMGDVVSYIERNTHRTLCAGQHGEDHDAVA